MYYLHYLRFTLDERKTLTKISTHKTSHNCAPNQRTLRTTKKQGSIKRQTTGYTEKSCLHSICNCLTFSSASLLASFSFNCLSVSVALYLSCLGLSSLIILSISISSSSGTFCLCILTLVLGFICSM